MKNKRIIKNLNNIKNYKNIKYELNQKLNYLILEHQDKVKILLPIHKQEELFFTCLQNYFKYEMDKDKENLIQNYLIYFLILFLK